MRSKNYREFYVAELGIVNEKIYSIRPFKFFKTFSKPLSNIAVYSSLAWAFITDDRFFSIWTWGLT